VPKGGVGIAIEVDVLVARKYPLFADGLFELAQRVGEIFLTESLGEEAWSLLEFGAGAWRDDPGNQPAGALLA